MTLSERKSEGRIAGEGHKAAKERVRQEKLAKVAKVIGLSKLKSKYESHEAKRNLCAQYDLFIADDRIIPSLPKLIGEVHCSMYQGMSARCRQDMQSILDSSTDYLKWQRALATAPDGLAFS